MRSVPGYLFYQLTPWEDASFRAGIISLIVIIIVIIIVVILVWWLRRKRRIQKYKAHEMEAKLNVRYTPGEWIIQTLTDSILQRRLYHDLGAQQPLMHLHCGLTLVEFEITVL